MKRIFSCILCVLLLVPFLSAYADNEKSVRIFGYDQAENVFNIFVNATVDTYISTKDVSVTLGGKQLPVESIESYCGSEYGTSYIFVTDPASKGSATRKFVLNTIQSIVNDMGINDNAAVYCSALTTRPEFTSSHSSIITSVEEALNTSGTVKLYEAIKSALSAFETRTDLNSRKCLIIISQGKDKGSEYTIEEAIKKIQTLPISVFSVCTNMTAAKDLDKLSRATGCGFNFNRDYFSDSDSDLFYKSVQEEENKNYILSTGLSDLGSSNINADLIVSIEQGKQRISDTVTGISLAESIGTASELFINMPEQSSGKIDFTTITDKVFSWPTNDRIINIMIYVLCILLIIFVIILLCKKGKKEKVIPDLESENKTEPVHGESVTTPVRKIRVIMTNVQNNEIFSYDLLGNANSFIAGRDDRDTQMILSKDDMNMSRKHIKFIWEQGNLYLQPISETNSTYINGKEITGKVFLQQNAIIQIGASSFKINWEY